MSYRNNNNNNRGNYTNNNNGGNYNNNNNVKPFKRSGCTFHVDCKYSSGEKKGQSKGIPCITAWNYSKQYGLSTFVALPAKDVSVVCKATGEVKNDREKWVATITTGRTVEVETCFYTPSTGKLRFPFMNMVANPNAPSGQTRSGKTVKGYWGKSGKPTK